MEVSMSSLSITSIQKLSTHSLIAAPRANQKLNKNHLDLRQIIQKQKEAYLQQKEEAHLQSVKEENVLILYKKNINLIRNFKKFMEMGIKLQSKRIPALVYEQIKEGQRLLVKNHKMLMHKWSKKLTLKSILIKKHKTLMFKCSKKLTLEPKCFGQIRELSDKERAEGLMYGYEHLHGGGVKCNDKKCPLIHRILLIGVHKFEHKKGECPGKGCFEKYSTC
jgi:hypothetical protein